MGTIYLAKFPNEKVYVGKTVKSFLQRRREHINNCKNKNHVSYSTKFYKALRKYMDSVIWEALHKDVDTVEELNLLEVNEIKRYNSFKKGYNSTLGGEGSFGRVWEKKTLSKISKKAKDRLKNKNNHPMFGRKHSSESKKKMSHAHKNREKSKRQLKNLEKGQMKKPKFIYTIKSPDNEIVEVSGRIGIKKYLDNKKGVSFFSIVKYGHSRGHKIIKKRRGKI